jgi:cytochrome P450
VPRVRNDTAISDIERGDRLPETNDQFDLYASDMAGRWVEVWRSLQEQERVVHSDLYGGYYVLTRHADVCAAARDDDTFSSYHDTRGTGNGEGGIVISPNPFFNGFIELDPPEYQMYRRIVAPWFAPANVKRLAPLVEEATIAAIDLVIESGQIDLVMDFAKPIPAAATLLLMGMDVEHWKICSDAFHEFIYLDAGTPEHDGALAKHAWILEELQRCVTDRRQHPRDDVITALCGAELGAGRPLTDQDVVDTLYLFLGGGLNTTMSLVSHALVWLDDHRDARQQLIERPGLMASACEEFLRWCTPTQGLARTVTRECEFAGRQFQRGDRLLLTWAAANVDPEVFDRPEEVILDRSPNPHTAWGVGGHKCIGANLARSEFATMLTQVLTRLPDYKIDRSAMRPFPKVGLTNGYISMPATFTPGQRVGAESEIVRRMGLGKHDVTGEERESHG